MNPEKVEQLYNSVLEREPGQRAAFLAEACHGDEELRREVESLLAHHGALEWLSKPAWEGAGSSLADATMTRLGAGDYLGPYCVEALLGAGGMGQVYRARDTRLGRMVAIKVADKQFSTQFEREARAISSLNHPNICTLYDVGPNYLVMELVEGVTLAGHLKQKPLPLELVMKYGAQIAEGLAEAHAKGITHRDLKPGNIMITKNGVKVLDFGLAKFEAPGGTLRTANAVMGTPAYMAPEQLEGKECDARTDIFALGLVLHEAATGKRLVQGQPAALEGLPERLVHVIERCLAKEPENRWQTARDIKEELQWAAHSQAVVAPGSALLAAAPRRKRLRTAAYALAGVGIAAGIAWVMWPRPIAPPQIARFAVQLPLGEIIQPVGGPHGGNSVAISRDGTKVAFVGNKDGRIQLYVRAVGELDTKPLPETLGAWSPVFSPDGRWLAFLHNASRTIRRVALSGGASVPIADYESAGSASWERDDSILTRIHLPGAIVRIAVRDGTSAPLTQLDLNRDERSHFRPSLLPGGKAVLFSSVRSGDKTFDEGRVEVQVLATNERRVLVEGGCCALYSPTGHIIYARAETLLAVPFDLLKLAVVGPPVPVLEGVSMGPTTGIAHFDLSENGTLVYAPGVAFGADRTVVWVDRQGNAETLPLPPAMYLHPRLSPDGRQIAVEVEGPTHDIYTYDVASGVLSKFTTEGSSHWPLWTPSGDRITYRRFAATGFFTMWWITADRSSSPERLTDIGRQQSPASWSPDGKVVAFTQVSPETGPDVYVMSMEDRKPRVFAQSKFAEGSPRFSPDGRWIAYSSNESGRNEIYVQAYPGPGAKFQISPEGGTDAVWKPTGGELFYRSGGKMMAASVTTSPFSASKPRLLWEGNYTEGTSSSCGPFGATSSNYDVSADGQRFLMIKDNERDTYPTQVNIVLNWTEELKRLVASKKN